MRKVALALAIAGSLVGMTGASQAQVPWPWVVVGAGIGALGYSWYQRHYGCGGYGCYSGPRYAGPPPGYYDGPPPWAYRHHYYGPPRHYAYYGY